MHVNGEARSKALETIVTYFTGITDLSTSKVLDLACGLQQRPQNTGSGDLGMLQQMSQYGYEDVANRHSQSDAVDSHPSGDILVQLHWQRRSLISVRN